MAKISIIIPHRGNALGLWATIHSCEEDLKYTDIIREYIVVSNGDVLSVDQNTIFKFTSSKVVNVHQIEPLSPPDARSLGVQKSSGDTLFFFDDHCLVSREYFRRALSSLERTQADVLHTATKFYMDDPAQYHYCLRLEYNFWGTPSPIPTDAAKPYKVAMAGHGAFVMPTASWKRFDGYGPGGLLSGYGAEEPLLDLKVWLSGGTVWLDPRLLHYHSPCGKSYRRHFTDDYYKNIMKTSLMVGGEVWLDRIYDGFVAGSHTRLKSELSWFDLLSEAQSEVAEYAHKLRSTYVEPLDTFLASCGERLIAK